MGTRSAIPAVMSAVALLGGALVYEGTAVACGCFTPPDPTVPVVQAGEQILFSSDAGVITAQIKIQYQGDAKEFGWLLPLPSLPKLELGTDELFTKLVSTTQPKYRVNRVYPNRCGGQLNAPGAFGASASDGGVSDDSNGGKGSPLVLQDSIGPYDYAVLKADDRSAMLDWLNSNHYYVPTSTQDATTAYIHPGAFFLALKLRSGKSTGDLQPVVVKYASDLPMIPIVLTSVGASPHMGVEVWTLGSARAIPRNYYHSVVNDALIDYVNNSQNYNDVVIRAVAEAPGKHAFVTEYAGKSSIMQGQLDAPGRFGQQSDLASITDAALLSTYFRSHQFTFVGPLVAVLAKYIPEPQSLVAQGLTASQYFQELDYILGAYRQQHPDEFVGLDFHYDATALAADVWSRVVTPTLTAAQLFVRYPYLTRLYTTLSPEDMTQDPVFSFNPDLPDVSNVHDVTMTYVCDSSTPSGQDAWIKTEQGWYVHAPGGLKENLPTGLPAALRTERLREAGAPEVVTDNSPAISSALGQNGSGCSLSPTGGSPVGLAGLLLLLGTAVVLSARRRRS